MRHQNTNQLILAAAEGYLGLKEWPGAKHNPEVLAMFEEVGHGWVNDDETPWCAAFIGSVLASLGVQHTGSLRARSYEAWGENVPLAQALPGDIAVFWRKTRNGPYGHVAVFDGWDDDGNPMALGGNQGNKVSRVPYNRGRLLCIRRASSGKSQSSAFSTVRMGDKGTIVKALQRDLHGLRYFSGRVDGDFGKRTRGAVLTFQADNDLTPDGIVGRKTWAALREAQPRELRKVTMQDLDDSGTMADTRRSDRLADITGLGGVAKVVTDAQNAVGDAQGAADGLLGLWQTVQPYWPIALIVVAYLVWRGINGQTRFRRLRDAQTGAHDGR